MVNKIDYAVGRVAEDTQQFDYVRVNERNLSVFMAQNFDDAGKYDDLEQAKKVVQAQNLMSQIFGGNYEYKVVQRDTTFTVLNENGEEEPEHEVPVDEPTE